MLRWITLPLVLLALATNLAACGGGGGAGGSAVIGRVVSPNGSGSPGLTVWIQGQSTMTDATGAFEIPDVVRPYDVVIFAPQDDTVMFVGLTRADPTLETDLSGNNAIYYSATISGTVNGGAGFPQPPNHWTKVFETAPVRFGGKTGMPTSANSAYGLSMGWSGPDSVVATMHALQMEDDPVTAIPISYTGYGATSLALTDGTFPDTLVSMSPVSTNTMSGALVLPMGYSASAVMYLADDSTSRGQVFKDSNPSVAFSYPVPGVPTLTSELEIRASGPQGRALATLRGPTAGSAGHVVDFLIPSAVLSPAQDAVGVGANTSLSATPSSGQIYRFRIQPYSTPMNPVSGPTLLVIGSNPNATIPDLSMFGKALPSSTPYRVTVETIRPFASIDEATGSGGLSRSHPTLRYVTFSPSIEVTTAP